ncbi:MAG TPA: hypothetical protein VFA07_03515 [Chthonomonadaceae bacterium]|nr:hypothetical protein [Chthonomonadaceae bacterium]
MKNADDAVQSRQQPGSADANTVSAPHQAEVPHKSRIMYIERKAGRLIGEARIGRVTYSKSGRTIYYGGKMFRRQTGFKST